MESTVNEHQENLIKVLKKAFMFVDMESKCLMPQKKTYLQKTNKQKNTCTGTLKYPETLEVKKTFLQPCHRRTIQWIVLEINFFSHYFFIALKSYTFTVKSNSLA